ncbi:MAG: hypothetical protein WCG75_08900 [Armatimonadota bacterium]
MNLRLYVQYWVKLAIATSYNWGQAKMFVPPTLLGNFHARMDVSNDVLKVFYRGLKPLWAADTESVLLSSYKIEYINLCHFDHLEWYEAFENAYNRVSQVAIRHKFGIDVVELCLATTEYRHREQVRKLSSNSALNVA